MLTPQENALLCEVEGDAPMGALMRRHWIPALLSEELEVDGKPRRVRLLGEDLVAFRDSDGKVGLIDEFCPHRGPSLAYARNENCGLRCLYHGWKFDVAGRIVEMPSEPEGSPLKEKTRIKAYPVEECGGFVWAYMGPPESRPAFQRPPFSPVEGTPVSILKIRIPCNWAQIQEGQIDSAHSSNLHSSDMVPARVAGAGATETNWTRPSTDKSPRMLSRETPYGFRYVALRRPIQNARTHDYARVTVYVAPFISLIPPNSSYNVASINVPADNTSTWFYFLAWGGEDCVDQDTWRAFNHAVPGVDLNDDFTPRRTLENDFMQDREAMRAGNFTGIDGIPNQDMSMWVSMGPITDRSTDRLGGSDIAVVEFRRLMVDAVRRFAEGNAPAIGTTEPGIPHREISSFEGIVEKGRDWLEFGTTEAERAILSATAQRAS
ncbi:Rieske 2Fe-2S domain-containing protein [Oceanibacterium hippocampi]|uniref:Phthalate 4,5-dioxygenase oxygenase subunit n=1 Tax=Oceanibacterium hippocampi TaxID=745714 RepID=A0A1Y5TX01_9PROT|nr:Rieske 2Fe-2S domain-containing protein [Oceanibacterium hippocampi]SLN75755.1 Phthalate 4,5-dioxygenase oxygenase subunit [Oceanibacterium hippocampi]